MGFWEKIRNLFRPKIGPWSVSEYAEMLQRWEDNRPEHYPTEYPELTKSILEELAQRDDPDEDLEQAVMEYVNGKIDYDYEHAAEIVRALPPQFRMIYTTWWVEAEVINGGFNQYFWNSAGQLAIEAHDGFVMLGADRYAAIMRDAIATAANSTPEWRKLYQCGTLDAFIKSYKTTTLDVLDQRFYKLQGEVSLRTLYGAYIKAHIADFVTKE